MEITYYGHSCFLIQIGEHRLLFDPFIRPNTLAEKINIDNIEADYIILSHAHEDHTADAEYLATKTGATIIANWEICAYYNRKGLSKTHPMNLGGKWNFPFGMLKMVNAVHSSSFPDGTYGGNPAGFVLKTNEKTLYYAGDTALFSDMKQLAKPYRLDFAILPVGDNFTMDVKDAMIAADYLQINKIIGMHYDTFPYIEINSDDALIIAKAAKKELILPEIGSTLTL